MRNRHWAWAVSGGLHAVAAVGVTQFWWVSRSGEPAPVRESSSDLVLTLREEPVAEPAREVTVELVPGPAKPVEGPSVEARKPAEVPDSPDPVREHVPLPASRPAAAGGQRPTAFRVPAPLPASVTRALREVATRPRFPETVRDVVDIHTPATIRDPAITPAAAVEKPRVEAPSGSPFGETAVSAGKVLFSPRSPAKSVVYVLDCSGTMGLGGRFERACAALRATLAALPAGVRVQVVAYSGRATAVTTDGLAAAEAARDRIEAALRKLEPAGESRHLEGLRVALHFAPEAVIFLTDAEPGELAALAPLIRGARRAVTVSIVRIGETVADPVPFR